MKKYYDAVKEFVYYTGKDFGYVWRLRPNVLIWCAIAGLVLFFV